MIGDSRKQMNIADYVKEMNDTVCDRGTYVDL